jgi:hypothetical protein
MLDALCTRDVLPEVAATRTSASLASSVTRNMALGSDSVTTLHVRVCARVHARYMDRASQSFCSIRRGSILALAGAHLRAVTGIILYFLASDSHRVVMTGSRSYRIACCGGGMYPSISSTSVFFFFSRSPLPDIITAVWLRLDSWRGATRRG